MVEVVPSRGRYWLRQGVLWGALLVALGLAALVKEYWSPGVELEPAPVAGELHVRQPKGWMARHSAEGVSLEEPAGRGKGRRLEIRYVRTGGFVSPLEFLVRSGSRGAEEGVGGRGAKGAGHSVKAITIAGWPGILRTHHQAPGLSGVEGGHYGLMLACAVLPWGRALLLRLEGERVGDEADEDLVVAVAESLGFENPPAVEGGNELELPGPIRVTIPEGFATCAVEDKYRTGRMLVAADAGGWLGVELASCWVLGADPEEVLEATMRLRDPEWSPGEVRRIDERTWVCQRRSEDGFPGVGYLQIDGKGLGILAEFRWNDLTAGTAMSEGRLDSIWRALGAGVRFAGDDRVPKLVQSGVTAVQQALRGVGGVLDTGGPVTERWEWYDEAMPNTSHMRVEYRVEAAGLRGLLESDRSSPLGQSGRELGQWRLAGEGGGYEYSLLRVGPGAVVSQESQVGGGQLSTTLRQGGNVMAQTSGPVPESYLPGAILPLLLGRLPHEPMLVRTESMLMPGGSASAVPLVLMLEPALDVPKVPPGEGKPMQCWAVHVSGTGQSSRWYIDREGLLDSISYANGIHLHRVRSEEDGMPATGPLPATQPSPAAHNLPMTRPVLGGEKGGL